jgi:hypothetical protein
MEQRQLHGKDNRALLSLLLQIEKKVAVIKHKVEKLSTLARVLRDDVEQVKKLS